MEDLGNRLSLFYSAKVEWNMESLRSIPEIMEEVFRGRDQVTERAMYTAFSKWWEEISKEALDISQVCFLMLEVKSVERFWERSESEFLMKLEEDVVSCFPNGQKLTIHFPGFYLELGLAKDGVVHVPLGWKAELGINELHALTQDEEGVRALSEGV